MPFFVWDKAAPLRLLVAIFALFGASTLLFSDDTTQDYKHKAIFLHDENQVASARLGFVRGEKTEILATTFLFDGTKAGAMALAELRQAARNGAKVKLVIDGVEYGEWVKLGLTPGLLLHLRNEGVDIRVHNPINLKDPRTFLKPSNAIRNHEKLMILVGQQVAATGDRNMQNINFRLKHDKRMKGLSYRSVETFVQGPEVEAARQHFMQDVWQSDFTRIIDLSKVSEAEVRHAARKLDKYIEISQKIPGTAQQWLDQMKPVRRVKFSYDFPNPMKPGDKIAGLDEDLFERVGRATKRITLVSPYIRLPERFKKLILKLMKEKGVQLEIIVPSATTTDAAITLRAFRRQAREFIKAGAMIWEHQGPDFLHAKMIEIDGVFVYIGSHNLSHRSWLTDYESGFFFEDEAYAAEVHQFHEDMILDETLGLKQPMRNPIQFCADLLMGAALTFPPINHQM